MWDNPNAALPLPIPHPRVWEDYPLARGSEPSEGISLPKEENFLQRLLTESSSDELACQLAETFRPVKSDLVEMVSRSVTVLSTMAAELGVVLRVQVRAEKISADVDEEKLRRVLNALAIHLLSVSQPDGWVTIGLDELAMDGRRGFSLRLTADNVILPMKTSLEYEEELNTQAELSLCRKIVEKHGGGFSVHFQDENKLTYAIWFAA
jgi:light-regulated signal transduction histidine kinase (bacteriophytochrome)